jgi:hypothetical protein
MQNFKRNIVFLEKRKKIFRRKLAKIAENCDHNIDPWWMTLQKKTILQNWKPKVFARGKEFMYVK